MIDIDDFDNLPSEELLAAEARGGWPFSDDMRAAEDLAYRTRLKTWFFSTKKALLELVPAGQRFEVERGLWEDLGRFGDPAQRLRIFRAELVSHGLVDQAAALAVPVVFVDPAQRERDLEAAKERQELQAALDRILQAAGDRQRALALYNGLPDGPRTWDKLDNFVRQLVEAGLLPVEWRAGRRVGSLADFLRKMLPGAPSNKMLTPNRENK